MMFLNLSVSSCHFYLVSLNYALPSKGHNFHQSEESEVILDENDKILIFCFSLFLVIFLYVLYHVSYLINKKKSAKVTKFLAR